MIYVGKKNRNRVKDLVVYEVDKDSGKVSGTVRAASGIMSADAEKALLKIDLFDVRMEIPDEKDPDNAAATQYVSYDSLPLRLNFKELLGEKNIHKKRKNMTIFELIHRVRNAKLTGEKAHREFARKVQAKELVEIHQRLCLSISPLMFVMIAIPLGITSHRKESSIGMLMSLVIMFVYYIFIILSDTLDKYPAMMPWLIPWIPIVLGQIGSLVMMRRAD
jgi:lipopolysaccharide export system permease protein